MQNSWITHYLAQKDLCMRKNFSFFQKYWARHPFEVKYEKDCSALQYPDPPGEQFSTFCTTVLDNVFNKFWWSNKQLCEQPEVKLSVQKRPSRRTIRHPSEAADLLDEYAVPLVVGRQLPWRPKIRFYLIHGHSPAAAASIPSVGKCSTSKVSPFCLPQVEGRVAKCHIFYTEQIS